MTATVRLYPGDLVEVKTPEEILDTLDAEGTLAKLPFMAEMLELCGKRFRVFRRVVKTCTSGSGSSTMRAFPDDDVVVLEGIRCTGADHDGCQKACMIFWREAWLRKVTDVSAPPSPLGQRVESLRARLKTKIGPNAYFCQASELARAAPQLSRPQRFTKCFAEIAAKNCTPLQMLQRISIWAFWRVRRAVLGPFGRGTNKTTPAQSLNLEPGQLVKVKSMEEISQTLDEKSFNRGLWFSPDMGLICGTEQCVERKVDKLVVDCTGEMRQLRNTVYLEGSMCGCAHVAFGGCSRGEFAYWREIWLKPNSTPPRP
jgi:hypothetical protein